MVHGAPDFRARQPGGILQGICHIQLAAQVGNLAPITMRPSTVGRRSGGGTPTLGLRCIAVPILGSQQRVVAALSCSIPLARLDTAKALRILSLLQEGAAQISRNVGARPSNSVRPVGEEAEYEAATREPRVRRRRLSPVLP